MEVGKPYMWIVKATWSPEGWLPIIGINGLPKNIPGQLRESSLCSKIELAADDSSHTAMSHSYTYRVAIHFGSLVDDYLASEGAIAQAMDQNTILMGSAVFGMNSSDQRLLLLHELAHVQQLATAGNDPLRSLEDEAWEAAHAWAAGSRYCVRGRARNPLNALAIIQGGDRGHPSAPPWYSSNPVEPIGNKSTIIVKEVVVQKGMTLESVMDTIIEKKEKQVVIVCHGWSEGLAIPLVAGSSLGTATENVARLAADQSFKRGELNTPIIADKDVAHQLSEDRVKSLRAKIKQIRGLNLEHVAFRSCDMGKSPDTAMDAFQLLLGVKSVSAPKLLDSYGQFRPEIGGDIKTWVETKRKKHGFRVWVDRGVAFGIRTARTSQIQYQIVSRAPDNQTFATWVRAHVADRPGTDNALVYHGMEDRSVADQTAPIIYFVRDAAFIANIVFYSG